MKSKLSIKVLGVVVTIATLASLLIGITAPVSAAASAPGTNAWTYQNTPSQIGNVLVAGVKIATYAVSPDGMTIFAYGENKMMYVSTDGGKTFAAGFAVGGAGTGAQKPIAMAISPNFATDKIAVFTEGSTTAADNHVWWTTTGGASAGAWVDVANASLQADITAAVAISSVDVGYYYSGNTPSIIIGLGSATNGGSNVLKFAQNTFAWTAFGGLTNPVVGVKFSANHASDYEIMAVFTNGGSTYLTSSIGGLAFDQVGGSVAYPRSLIVAGTATKAIIATASDYIGNTGAPILIGTTGLGASDGVYRVAGRNSGSGPTGAVVSAVTGYPIASLVVSGPLASATAYYGGSTTAANVYRSTNFNTPSTATWSGASKAPTGTATLVNTLVALGGTTVFAVTNGATAGSADTALSVSADGGADFNQTALIEVGTIASMTLKQLEVVDMNTMFLIMSNGTGGTYKGTSVFKTVNAGTNWQRILTGTATQTLVSASPAYATDTTVFVGDTGSPLVQKSVNGGTSWVPVGVFQNPTVLLATTGGNFYTGGNGGSTFYKSGSPASGTGITGTVTSIAISPADATGATIAVGTTTGTVWQSTNSGASFTQVGSAAISGTTVLTVAYGPNGKLYAADATTGLYLWSGSAWSASLGGASASTTGFDISKDGTVYILSSAAGASVFRTLNPSDTTPTFLPLNVAGMSFPAAGSFADGETQSGTTANTIYGIDTAGTLTATTGFGYTGAILAFTDNQIAVPAITAPANNAVLTSTTTAAISWPAVTSATDYQVSLDGAAWASVGNKTAVTIGDGIMAAPLGTPLVAGTSHTWAVRVDSTTATVVINNDLGRPSATNTFITALPPVGVVAVGYPLNGAVNVPVDATFSWPSVPGATYEFVLAEELGNVDKFAIIDYSATTPTNAIGPKETLKYNTLYWWRVRAVTATSTSAWSVYFFTTAPAPVVTTATSNNGGGTTLTVTNTSVVITQQPATTITYTNGGTSSTEIPAYLLWAVVAVGAVLVISVIVLIVRTRKI